MLVIVSAALRGRLIAAAAAFSAYGLVAAGMAAPFGGNLFDLAAGPYLMRGWQPENAASIDGGSATRLVADLRRDASEQGATPDGSPRTNGTASRAA